MGEHNNARQESIISEQTVLTIYTLFCVLIASENIASGVGAWPPFIITVIVMGCWGMFLSAYRDEFFRSSLTTALMQVAFWVYALNETKFSNIAFNMVVISIIAGLYGITELIMIDIASGVVVVLFYLLIKYSFNIGSFLETEGGLQIVLMFFAQILILKDVKCRQKIEKEITDAVVALHSAEQSKNTFLRNVSHEVRTPINTIFGVSEILLQKNVDNEIRGEMERLQSASQSLLSVVNDIMDFSELQSDKIKIEEEAYNISSTINDIIIAFEAKKNDSKVEFIVDCDPSIPSILLGDEKKIRRVLMNLLDNSLKFTEEGYICLKIRSRIEFYGVNLAFSVIDTGIGMTQESLEKLFMASNQANADTTRMVGGIGLGINISKQLVEKMGGIMTVESEYGKGSVLKFVVPQKVLENKPIAAIEHPENIYAAVYINFEKFSVMAIRDEYRKIIQCIVDQYKVKCLTCRNIVELKRRVKREKFTHVFITKYEYLEDKEFFDELSEQLKLIIILDRNEEEFITNDKIQQLYKPFYILPIVASLNSKEIVQPEKRLEDREFIAPDAHVLIVDDNVMNIHVIEGLLEKYQIKTTVALGGQEALQKIETKDYDFVFMDHMMPGMDGIETFKAIRNMPGTYFKKVPIVALTANAVAGSREMFLEEGFQDFLEKPIERRLLERVLRRNIAKRKILVNVESKKEETRETENNALVSQIEEPQSSILDLETGYIYCGGKDKYMDIIATYALQAEDNYNEIQKLLDNDNWKDYTITVHGIKSFMSSIGAGKVSKKAKDLEMAGKADDIAYIRKNHDDFMSDFRKVIEEIYRLTQNKQKSDQMQQIREQVVLTPNEMEAMIRDFEEAMYEFDEQKMADIVEDLEECVYNGCVLKPKMQVIRRKVEVGDCMSAMEMLLAIGEVK